MHDVFVAAYFFIYIRFLSGRFFKQSQLWIYMKQTETTARRMRTFDTCAHPYVYSTYQVYISKYVLYTYNMAAVLLHVVGAQVENTAVRVHVPGTHYIVHTWYFTTTNDHSSSSSTAASFVFCCLFYAIYGSIESSVLLLLHLNSIH